MRCAGVVFPLLTNANFIVGAEVRNGNVVSKMARRRSESSASINGVRKELRE